MLYGRQRKESRRGEVRSKDISGLVIMTNITGHGLKEECFIVPRKWMLPFGRR